MIHLQVLGRLELHGSDGRVLHSVLAQPKRQGVLIYLAVATPRGYHRRDTLVALLWPDSDDEHARGSLSKAVSHLRQTVGADVLLSRGHAELGLDWQLVQCDAAEFEDALDRGALADAMALYRGDLLPGFHIDEVPEFEQWLERERTRLRARAVRAAQLLSEREDVAGRIPTSIEWARRAAELEPFDESIVRRVMTLLDRASDRAGALRTYDEFTARLHVELEAEPAAETMALAVSIRERPTPTFALPVVAAPPVVTPPPVVPPAVAPTVVPPPAAAVRETARRPGGQRVAAFVVGATAIATLAAWPMLGRSRMTASVEPPAATVVLLPFVVEGTTAVPAIGDTLVSSIAERFNQEGSLRSLDAQTVRTMTHAIRPDIAGADSARTLLGDLRPRYVLLGHVAASRDSVRITAALFDGVTERDPVARAEVVGMAHDMARLSSDVAWQILTARPTGGARRGGRPPVATLTPSLIAVREYLKGEREFKAGRFVGATNAFKTAVDADTTFAPAYLNLSRAANWAGDFAMADFALQRAMRYADRLNQIDQLRLRSWSAYQRGEPMEAERLTRLILVNDAGSYDAWYDLGELRLHWGALLGWTIGDARAAYEQALALSGDDAGTILHLARIAAAQGRVAAVDSLAERAIAMSPDEPHILELRALRAHSLRSRVDVSAVNAAVAKLDDGGALAVARIVAVYAGHSPSARGVTDALRHTQRAPHIRAMGAVIDAELAMAHGRTAEALRAVTPGTTLTPARSLEYRAAFASLPFRETPAAEALAIRGELLALRDGGLIGPLADHIATNDIYPPRRAYLLAMLSIKASDTTAAMQYVRQLEGGGSENEMDRAYRLAVARLVRAELLRKRGSTAKALATLESPRPLPNHVLPDIMHYPSAHERYLRGELLAALGRWAEARRWYDTFPDPAGYDLMYLAPVAVAMGAAHEKEGDPAAARASYRRAVELLADADPEWLPLRERARAALVAQRE